MKKIICLVIGLFALNLIPAFGQSGLVLSGGSPGSPETSESESKLIRFSLDFHGGTPAELVKAIEKATSKPLNAIIPDDSADVRLPALKMNDVNVSQLFNALEQASQKR